MEKQNLHAPYSVKSKGLLSGILLIAAGLLFLSFNFGWLNPDIKPIIFSWPMLFVALGIMKFSRRDPLVSILLFGVGIFFLLPRVAMAFPELIPGLRVDFAATYWPFLLIMVGLMVIWRGFSRKKGLSAKQSISSVDEVKGISGLISKSVLFGGSNSIFLDPVFNGGSLSATFGGIVLDLRRTSLPEGETVLYIDATFGGVELYVPGNWMVETRIQTIMGGVEDKRIVSSPIENRKLILRGEVIFGGCSLQ